MEGLRVPIVDVRKLSLSFEQDGRLVEVLRDLDLAIMPGEFVCLVGASGVGKSTLLRVLMGLAAPSGGSMVVPSPSPDKRAMALVFQDARLLPWRRVSANVAFGLENLGLTRKERFERSDTALGAVGLRSLGKRWPRQLSGGQRQRVALARALCTRPSVLLMDEPFSALDAPTREGLQDELARLQRAEGVTVLFVTHDIDEAVYLADRVVALGGRPGRVRSDLEVDVPRPRKRGSAALGELASSIKRDLAAEAPSHDDWVI